MDADELRWHRERLAKPGARAPWAQPLVAYKPRRWKHPFIWIALALVAGLIIIL